MKKLILFIAIVAIAGCENNTSVNHVKANKDTIPQMQIFVTHAMVYYCGFGFGFVGEGSVLFNIDHSVRGFAINVKQGDKILFTTFSDSTNLNNIIDNVKYKISQRDSVINLNTQNK